MSGKMSAYIVPCNGVRRARAALCVGKGTLAADGKAMCVLKRRVMAGAAIEMVVFARPVCFAAPPPQSVEQ